MNPEEFTTAEELDSVFRCDGCHFNDPELKGKPTAPHCILEDKDYEALKIETGYDCNDEPIIYIKK